MSCGVGALAVAATIAHGGTRYLVADNDPELESSFTVTFPPELGGTTQTADIPVTVFVLALDEETGTARLVTWFQQVDPFDLLGYSTGPIKVNLGGPSAGTYDTATGTFTTSETYNVHFDDTQLAAFGFVSPFSVPSTSVGTLAWDSEAKETGTILMNWGGVAAMENDSDPETPLLFTYSCTVSSKFDATTRVIMAENDSTLPNEFTVNFPPELGGETQTAAIPLTEFVMEIDEPAGTARLLSWSQQIEPFNLLGFSTGDIAVSLGGASSGIFDGATGQFDTSESYDVSFDDSQLSAFGFYSPFNIPSASTGVMTETSPDRGTVAMAWSGTGEVSNPSDPESPYVFSYSCAVNAKFGGPLCAGDANGDGVVDPLDTGHVLSRLGCAVGSGDLGCDDADQNGDGVVDPLDSGFVLSRFGACP